MSKPYFAVIMAGGTGTRLWPLSRKAHPKQFHAFLSEQTMLQETYQRLRAILPMDHIYVSTGTRYVDLVRENLPELAEDHIIPEPESRNTGPAIGLAILTIQAEYPEALIATVASDHAIKNPEEFQATLLAAFESVEERPSALVTVGINPTRPDTGFGYIKLGAEWKTFREKRVFQAESFKEKPDLATAEAYLRSFEYLWNASYFVFQARTAKTWLATYAPALLASLEAIVAKKKAQELSEVEFTALYGALDNVAIEPLIIEKLPASDRLVIPSALEWSDVGNWQTLYEFLTESSHTTDIIHGEHLGVQSERLFVHSEKKPVITVGVEDLVIVDTPDALLVARRDHVATDIKQVIEQLKQDHPELL